MPKTRQKRKGRISENRTHSRTKTLKSTYDVWMSCLAVVYQKHNKNTDFDPIFGHFLVILQFQTRAEDDVEITRLFCSTLWRHFSILWPIRSIFGSPEPPRMGLKINQKSYFFGVRAPWGKFVNFWGIPRHSDPQFSSFLLEFPPFYLMFPTRRASHHSHPLEARRYVRSTWNSPLVCPSM